MIKLILHLYIICLDIKRSFNIDKSWLMVVYSCLEDLLLSGKLASSLSCLGFSLWLLFWMPSCFNYTIGNRLWQKLLKALSNERLKSPLVSFFGLIIHNVVNYFRYLIFVLKIMLKYNHHLLLFSRLISQIFYLLKSRQQRRPYIAEQLHHYLLKLPQLLNQLQDHKLP